MANAADMALCEFCRLPFARRGRFAESILCPDCMEKYGDQIELIQDTIMVNPNVSLKELSMESGMPTSTIKTMIDRGLIKLSQEDFAPIFVGLCRRCNKPITEGRYCRECKLVVFDTIKRDIEADNKLQAPIATASNRPQPAKMRYGGRQRDEYGNTIRRK